MTSRSPILQLKAFILLFWMASTCCKKDSSQDVFSPGSHQVKLEIPGNFPAAAEDADNLQTKEGVALGRALFYETRLSANNKISCASCHRQDLAFSDGLAQSDQGISGKQMTRNAPALFNLAWSDSGLFWDGGAKNLESQAFGPLTNEDEMHQDLVELEAKLNAMPKYVSKFKLAFKEGVSSANVVKALAQFQRTLISAGSRYDMYKRGEAGGNLSAIELEGLSLVESKCKGCHSGELFTDYSYHNNGIDESFSDELDGIYQGRFRVSFNPLDIGKFKTPTLRNILLTAPYMHDGRFNSIEDVLDHYSSGIKRSATVDQLLIKDDGNPGIVMKPEEKNAVLAFLKTLTDQSFIQNKNISKPN